MMSMKYVVLFVLKLNGLIPIAKKNQQELIKLLGDLISVQIKKIILDLILTL